MEWNDGVSYAFNASGYSNLSFNQKINWITSDALFLWENTFNYIAIFLVNIINL